MAYAKVDMTISRRTRALFVCLLHYQNKKNCIAVDSYEVQTKHPFTNMIVMNVHVYVFFTHIVLLLSPPHI